MLSFSGHDNPNSRFITKTQRANRASNRIWCLGFDHTFNSDHSANFISLFWRRWKRSFEQDWQQHVQKHTLVYGVRRNNSWLLKFSIDSSKRSLYHPNYTENHNFYVLIFFCFLKMCPGRHIQDGRQIIRLRQSFYQYQYIPRKQGMKVTLNYIIMINMLL